MKCSRVLLTASWTANYFRGVKPPRQRRQVSEGTDEMRTQVLVRSNQATPVQDANHDKGRFPHRGTGGRGGQRKPFSPRPLRLHADEERIPTVSSSNSSPAHASAVALVELFIERERNALSNSNAKDKLRFEVKSEVVPVVKMLLPRLNEADVDNDGDGRSPSISSSSTTTSEHPPRRQNRFVCVPSDRLPMLNNATEAEVAAFLASVATEVDQPLSNSHKGGSSLPPPHDDVNKAPSSKRAATFFSVEEIVTLLQLVVKYELHDDADLVVRLLREVQRGVQQRNVKTLRGGIADKSASDAYTDDEPNSTTTTDSLAAWRGDTSAVPQSSQRGGLPLITMTPITTARLLYYASEIGGLEEKTLETLLSEDVKRNMFRFNTRELVHVAVALCRFQATDTPQYRKIIECLGKRCEGTVLQENTPRHPLVASTAAANDDIDIKAIIPVESVAHPQQRIPIALLVELIKCVALSALRPQGLTAAIVIRLLVDSQRQQGLFTTPSASQLQYVCRVLRLMDIPSTELEGALSIVAAREKNGLVVENKGSTAEEEGASYDEFSADLVKV